MLKTRVKTGIFLSALVLPLLYFSYPHGRLYDER